MSNFSRTFGNQSSPIPLSYLDDNFSQLESASTSTVTLAGAALVGFVQPGTGATTRDLQTKVREIEVSITDFGGVADGSTANDTAFTNAKAALPSTGGTIKFPRAALAYNFANALALSAAGIKIKGDGKGTSKIKSTNSSGGHIVTVSADRCGVFDIDLEGTSGGGDGINVASVVSRLYVEKVRISTADRGVAFLDSNYLCKLREVEALNCRGIGFALVNGATAAHNIVGFDQCFAQTCAGGGFSILNTTATTLVDCAADDNTGNGFTFSIARATLTNCTAEANTARGFSVTGSGIIQMIGCRTFDQLLPFSIFGSANTTLYGPETTSTPSGDSLNLNSSATGYNQVIAATFDRTTSVDAAAKVNILSASAFFSQYKVLVGVNSDPGTGYLMALRQDTAGTTTYGTIRNLDNTNGASHAGLTLISGGSSGGDPKIEFGISGILTWGMGVDNSNGDLFVLGTNSALGSNQKICWDSNGNQGLGTTSFGTNAAGVFAIATGTAPTTGPADTVQFYSSDNSAGNTIPSFFCEGTEVIATGQADSASSVRVKMRINGTVVTLLAI